MPVLLVGSLIAGIILSSADFARLKSGDVSTGIFVLLLVLVFVVSVDVGVGLDRKAIMSLGKDAVTLSAATIVGSAAVGVALAFLPSLGLKATLASSLGMGWYTLAGPLAGASLGPLAGATAFLSNFLRELFTFITYPFFRLKLGGRNSISLGGATTMDTTLTVISATGGPETSALAFLHGVIITLLVPFILALVLAALP